MNPVLMPAQAYRRTWFADQLDELCGKGLFGALLRALAPAEYARVQNADPNRQIVALLYYINNHLFPINDYIAMQIEEGEHDWESVLAYGIPVAVFGFSFEYDAVDADIQVCLALGPIPEIHDEYAAALPQQYVGVAGKPPTCPRGRAWIEPWDAAGLLYEWVHGSTQNRWLDYDDELLEQGGLPEWNLDEIRALAADWEKTKPLIERLSQLHKLLIRHPKQNLPLLAGALAGDKAVIHRLTRPVRVKTLAEVLK